MPLVQKAGQQHLLFNGKGAVNSCLAEKVLTKDEILKGSFREGAVTEGD